LDDPFLLGLFGRGVKASSGLLFKLGVGRGDVITLVGLVKIVGLKRASITASVSLLEGTIPLDA
jgi:hypothetical protein